MEVSFFACLVFLPIARGGSGGAILDYIEERRDNALMARQYLAPSRGAVDIGIGRPCSSTSDCPVTNSICGTSGKCECGARHVAIGEHVCAKQAAAMGDACSVHAQCRHLDAAMTCYYGICLCEPHFFVGARACQSMGSADLGYDSDTSMSAAGPNACVRKKKLGEACCGDKECALKVWNSRCVERKCACSDGFVPVNDQLCARRASKLGDKCSIHAQCGAIAGSECKAQGFCWCNSTTVPRQSVSKTRRRRQSESENACLPLARLGEDCQVNEQCSARNSVCTANKCACASEFIARHDIECLPQRNKLNADNCTLSAQCSPIGDGAICDTLTDKCQCNATTHCALDEKCAALKSALGDTCADDCECAAIRATCSNNACACAAGRLRSADGKSCRDRKLIFDTKPKFFHHRQCCNGEGDAEVGRLRASGCSTETNYVVSISGAESDLAKFRVDTAAPFDRLFQRAGQTFSTTVTLTATITSAVDSSVKDTMEVIIIPDSCCDADLAALVSTSATAALGPGGTTCTSLTGTSNDVINFGAEEIKNPEPTLAELDVDIYENIDACNRTVTLERVALDTACDATLFRVDRDRVDFYTNGAAVVEPIGFAADCPLQLIMSSCSGKTSTFSFTLSVTCP